MTPIPFFGRNIRYRNAIDSHGLRAHIGGRRGSPPGGPPRPWAKAAQNFNTFGRGGVIADQATYDAVLRAHMIKVYNYMASGLALSGIVAFALFNVPSLAALFFEVTPRGVAGLNVLGWIAIFAPFGLLLLMRSEEHTSELQ